jgi:hypothetical protein
MKPKETTVSLYDQGKGEIHVWNVSFKLKGSAPTPATVSRLQKQIQKLVEALDIPE